MDSKDKKLIVIPGSWLSLGGTLVTLSAMIKGFEELGLADRICVLVKQGSTNESYLIKSGQLHCLQYIQAEDHSEFLQKSLEWVHRQPVGNPLLLDNWVSKRHFPILIRASPQLRISGRRTYHFFHDLAHSKKILGHLARRVTFALLAPEGICNSNFTASYIRKIGLNVRNIMYQPVDLDKFDDFKNSESLDSPPSNLKAIVESGAKIILTPSRISKPYEVNDKNLRALIPVLAELKNRGHHCHLVIIGQDISPEKKLSQDLINFAKQADISERFTILPPTYELEKYYRYADIVLTLAPREPFGRVVVEAIACGVPVVGSNTGGISEILKNFAPNWVVDPENTKQVSDMIVDTFNSPVTSQLLIKGKSWIRDECSPLGYAKQMIDLTQLLQ